MTDYYKLCQDGLASQLATLTDFFPVTAEKTAGWQISMNDGVIAEGGDYFVILRPGAFPHTRQDGHLMNFEWHALTVLHFRYKEYGTAWDDFIDFRSEIINKILSDPTLGGASHVFRALPSSAEEAGYLVDSDGNPTTVIVQALDVAIWQRVPVAASI